MKTNIAVISLVLLSSVFETSAFAYIDLGTGSLAIQMALATAMGVLYVARKTVRRALSLLKGKVLGQPRDTDFAKPVCGGKTDTRRDR